MARALANAGHGRLEALPPGPDHRQMVVFHEDPVAQAHPVVEPPAHPHGILVEPPHPRNGLPGVHDLDRQVGHGRHVPGSLGRDTGEALEKVQGHPFSLEDTGQGAAHGSHRVPRDDATPLRPQKLNRQARIDRGEDLRKDPRPGQHPGRPGHRLGPTVLLVEDQGPGGEIPADPILLQGAFNQPSDLEGDGS